MKKIIVLFLIFIIFFTACSKQSKYEAYVVSNDMPFTIFSNFVCSGGSGKYADGEPYSPAQLQEEIEEVITYHNDFAVVLNGKIRNSPSFRIYDDKLTEVYSGISFEPPGKQGVYLCTIAITWGNKTNYTGMQYAFKFSK